MTLAMLNAASTIAKDHAKMTITTIENNEL